MQNKKIWIAISSLIILSSLLAGCGGAATPTTEEDTFVCGMEGDVTSLDPQVIGAGAYGAKVPYYCFGGLTHWSLIDFHVMPALAESWENIDPLTWKFTLRQGVEFQNGQPFTAADVQFSFYRIMGRYNPNFMGQGSAAYKALIDEIETPDDYTVIIHTKYPEISIPYLVTWVWIVPKAYIEEVGDEGFARKPFGTGPFRIKERKVMEYIALEANQRYWNTNPEPGQLGPPKVKNVIYRIIPEESTRLAALKTGEVDATVGINADNAKELESDPDIQVYYSPRNEPSFVIMNWRAEKDPETGKPNPFRDVRVRRAMNYALDIDAIIANYGTGHEYRTTLLGKGGIGYNPNVPFYEYNPEKAKRLLAEAGYPNGFSTKFYAEATSPVFEAAQKYWKDIGVDVVLEVTTYPVIMKAMARKKLYGMTGSVGSFGPDPASSFFKATAKSDAPYALHGGDNRVDELIDKQAQEFDEAKRAKLIDEVIQIMWQDAWFVPLYEPVYIKAIRAEWHYDYDNAPLARSVVLTDISRKK